MSNFLRKIICLIILLGSLINIASTTDLSKSIEKPILCTVISSPEYLGVITSLSAHIKEEIVLSDSDFVDNHDVLLEHMAVLSTDMESILKSFELLDLFEEAFGALFMTANTQNGFNREYTSDGLNLHRNIILIHQGLIDHTYNQTWIMDDQSLLDGKYFQTSHYFPGFVDVPENSDIIENARVKCSYMLASGSQPWAEIGNPNVIRPTGCYLAPGSIAEIILPDALIGKGIKIRVGAHYWNLNNKSKYNRLDRVSITYDVNDVETKIAHPLGGGIYLEIPLGIDEGILDISLKNVVRSPFYSKKTFHETSMSDWLEVERKHSAPWADFETDKFMMQVPTSWIYEFEDPKTLLENWDKSMDAVSDLLGRPRITDRHKNYLQFDVVIRGSAYHPGYPMSNTPYNPNSPTNGTPNHNILRGPQYNQDIHFHELGHEVAISKFVGETEAIVNFLYVPVLNKCFNFSLAEAFQKSFGPSYNYTSTKDNSTRTRLVADTFHEGDPRNICSCTKNEVRYQHRGYAHYVDIVELFGWEALERFWQSESDAADMGSPFPVNNQEQDDRIFRMSKAAGVDLRPLFHFWGIHPNDQEALAQLMEDNNLALPLSIKSKLHQYRDLIPSNYDEFVQFGNELNPNFLNYSGGQFDFGPGWYKLTAETYDETKASKIEQALSDIIILYYGNDCFEVEDFLSPEFTFPTQYCKSNEVTLLPSYSDNGIAGSWIPEIVDASQVGQFEQSFIPNIDQCANESNVIIDVFETTTNIVGSPIFCSGSNTTLSTEENYENYAWVLDGNLISVSADLVISQSGMLHLIATDSSGCINEGEVLIMENEPIDISIQVTHPSCHGQYGSVLFVPSGGSGDGYTYSINGDSLMSGIYNVVVTDTLGCTKSFDFEVIQPTQIFIELIDNEVVVTGGLEPYDVVTIISDNTLYISVIDSNGCESSTEFTISALNEEDYKSVRVFPNPASELVYLDLAEVHSNLESFRLASIDGQLIQNYSIVDSVLDVSQLKNGVYIIQILFNNGMQVNRKILVLR